MKVATYNVGDPRFAPRPTLADLAGASDLLALYSPFGAVREVDLYPALGGQLPGLQGITAPFDLDRYVEFAAGRHGLQTKLRQQIQSGGKGLSATEAVFSALGEFAERFFALLTWLARREDLRLASYCELAESHDPLPPLELLVPFAPEQHAEPLPYPHLTPDTPIAWMPARHVRSGIKTFVPSQQVCLFHFVLPGETVVSPATSGGLACGSTFEAAVLNGVNELVERDTLNLSWHARLPGRRVPLESIRFPGRAGRLAETVRRIAPDTVVVRHETDLPDFAVVSAHRFVRGRSELAFSCGTAASVDPARAFAGAIVELFQTEHPQSLARLVPDWAASEMSQRIAAQSIKAAEALGNVADRINLYGYPEFYERVRDDLVPTETTDLEPAPAEDTADEFERALGALERRGIDPIVVDMLPDDYLTGRHHLSVTKVVIPELTPLNVPPFRLLGHPRYRTIRRDLGLQETITEFHELRHDELPFP
ncbi:MAG: YcaO-like family protein [Acidimicrobiia bacterium]